MKRKGIILAGGNGTRLFPITSVISKHLLPVYDKPMIYYPLSTLMLVGIDEILVITTQKDRPLFEDLLGNGHQWGINIKYAIQNSPDGLAQALIIAEEFLNGDPSVLILGDNIFFGDHLSHLFKLASEDTENVSVFTFDVKEPERYGVAEVDKDGRLINIEEKPTKPKSSLAVTGIYFLDKNAPNLAKSLKPSARGELEITDILNIYVKQSKIKSITLGRDAMWFDAGTHDSLLSCSTFVHSIKLRQGYKIGCPEEVAYTKGFIDKKLSLIHI